MNLWAAINPFDHVLDSAHWAFFETQGWEIHLPWGLTRFKVLLLIAAVLMLIIFIPLARRARTGEPPRGGFWNAFEGILAFIREKVAKPSIGHDADTYVPFLWTVFLFVLFCNLLGMFPFLGSPTASIFVTGALALCSFVMFHAAAIVKMGPGKYARSLWPNIQIDLPGIGGVMGFVISLLLATIELFGTVIKSGVLAIRLFANMFAGHMVLATILLFIVTVGEAAGQFPGLRPTVR